jgi:hypothetical protein
MNGIRQRPSVSIVASEKRIEGRTSVMSRNLEQEFHEEMLAIYQKSGRATGYWPNRFLQKVRRAGGLPAAKDWLKPEKGLSPGLQRLARENRIDLSMEALVQRVPWKQLFTDEEVKEAQKRLDAASRMISP